MEVDDIGARWSVIEALLVLGATFLIDMFLPIHKMSWYKSFSEIISPNNVNLGAIFLSVIIKGILF